MFRVILLLVLPILITARSIHIEGRGAYNAAVVEFSPTRRAETPQALLQANLERYQEFARQAGTQDVDVLVFPEYGLTTTSPAGDRELSVQIGQEINDPALSSSNPCLENRTDFNHEVLRSLSCMARDNKLYLIANMIEREPCSQCADNFQIYNTNFAFDRQGLVVARYRKFNLFSEIALNVTLQPELITFTTDFNAKFGLFTCMDILFLKPAIQLVQELGVTDIAFPTAWFSELPFLTALQAQSAWSYGFDVTMLAAGYNRPEIGNTGSGIFAGLSSGSLKYLMAQNRGSHLLVARVPAISPSNRTVIDTNSIAKRSLPSSSGPEFRDILLKGDNMVNFTSIALPDNLGPHNVSVCQANLCCNLEFELSSLPDTFKYRLLVLDGIMSHDGGFYQSRTQICGLVGCSGNDTQSCSDGLIETAYVETTTFKAARLYGSFDTMFVQPNTLLVPDLSPLEPNIDFSFNTIPISRNKILTTLTLLQEKTAIRTFSIFAHDYE